MVLPPDIYTGAQFTIRYDEAKARIPEYYKPNSSSVWKPFGFESVPFIVVDKGYASAGDTPLFGSLYYKILARLELRNGVKELSAETPDAWMDLACRLYSELCYKWEPILAMEASQGFDVSNPNKESKIIEYGHVIDGSVQDTPYGELSDTSDYVTGRTHESHSGEDKIHERNELDAEIIMDLRKRWDATVNKIIEEFDVLFIRITGAGFVARGN